MKGAPVEFWFDFGSTYSYVAAMRVEAAARAAGAGVAWSPFLLGPLFRRQGWSDSPFNIYKARGAYMWRDLERQCRRHGLEWRKPSSFPRSGLLASRVAILPRAERWAPEFCRAVFRANFALDREIADRQVITGILREMGLDAPALLEEAVDPANKERLRERTEAAWEQGIFGAPTFVVDGELFWGNDRLEEALEWRGRPEAG